MHPVPLRARTKRPPLVAWKRYQDTAPTDAELERWFLTSEPRNIALVLGRGIFAVDLDGEGAEPALRAAGVELPQFAPRSCTQNGHHVLLEAPGPVSDRVGLLASAPGAPHWQVDIRGVGYIVAPPSLHPSGHAYAWSTQLPESRDDLPRAPQALLDLISRPGTGLNLPAVGLLTPGSGPDTPKWLVAALQGAPEGQRDQTCARLAGYFLGKSMPLDVVRATLLNWATLCRPPFPPAEVDKTIRSMQARDAAHGRRRQDPAVDITVTDADPARPSLPVPFQVLGYNQGLYFYLPIGARQVVDLRARDHVRLNLLALAPMQYWERAYPSPSGPSWALAANHLMRQAETAGVYDPARIRGRGAWWDETKGVVLHLGDRVLLGGVQFPVQQVPPSRYVYEAAPSMADPLAGASDPLTAGEASQLVDLLSTVSWDRPISARLLAGWCAVAPICGALTWRPHIWVTGAAGSGKTWVLDNIIRTLLGPIGLAVQSETTEAGLRQTLSHDARPVIFDEAEGENQRAQDRIQNVLALMRQASSETGSTIIKGSANGTAQSYRIRSCFAFSSIGVVLQQHADLTRVTVLTINRDTSDEAPERFKRLAAARSALITPEYVNRWHARLIRMVPVIRQNAAVFAAAGAAVIGSQRMGDQLGALLGGAYSLYDDEPITPEAAHRWLCAQDWSEQQATQDNPDEKRCLARILEHVLVIPAQPRTAQRSIAELIAVALHRVSDDITSGEAEDTLLRTGIKPLADSRQFVVANSHGAIERILQNTPWGRGWARILRRLPGAQAEDRPWRFAGVQCRGVTLDWHDDETDVEFPFGANEPQAAGRDGRPA
jgi:putative DNA primase/helicase